MCEHEHCDDPRCGTQDPDRAKIVQSIRAKIASSGHMIASIGADNDGPAYAYTVGLYPQVGYEFVISGLPEPDMKNALDALARRAVSPGFKPRDGLLVEDVFVPGPAGVYLPRLRLARPGHPFRWIAEALELESTPAVWQALVPDRAHRYPGDEGYDPHDNHQADFTVEPAPAQGNPDAR